MLWKSLITVIYPTWNSYKMQSWLGIISGYYPWSVSCKMYTLCRCRRHSLQLSVLPVGLSHWATVQHSPPHLLFCSPELVVSAVKGVQLWAAGKYDAAPYRSSATRAALWTAGGQRLVSPGWQEKLTQISHTSNECSKPHRSCTQQWHLKNKFCHIL